MSDVLLVGSCNDCSFKSPDSLRVLSVLSLARLECDSQCCCDQLCSFCICSVLILVCMYFKSHLNCACAGASGVLVL